MQDIPGDNLITPYKSIHNSTVIHQAAALHCVMLNIINWVKLKHTLRGGADKVYYAKKIVM